MHSKSSYSTISHIFTNMIDGPLSHDDFFRFTLSDPERARAFLENSLPSYIKDKLDLSQLEQMPGTFLSSDLRKTITDVVFKVPLKDDDGFVYVSFIIEHKSYPDKYILIQIGGYVFSAYQQQLKNQESLSLVIPILFYHGKDNWEYQVMENLFPDIEGDWKKFLPTIHYIHNNLNDLSDAEIESLNNQLLAACFLALKHIWDKNWLETNLQKILVHTSTDQLGLQKAIIFYIFSRNSFDEKILNSLSEPIKKDVMNTLDAYFERGIEKGRVEGIEEGKEVIVRNLITSKQFTTSQIANFAGVPESFVERVLAKMKND